MQLAATCHTPARSGALQLAVDSSMCSHLIQCDVNSGESIAAAFVAIAAAFGGEGNAKAAATIDLLINNAGISSPNHPIDPIKSVPADDVLAVCKTNVIGTVQVTQKALPFMAASSTKMIANLSYQLVRHGVHEVPSAHSGTTRHISCGRKPPCVAPCHLHGQVVPVCALHWRA